VAAGRTDLQIMPGATAPARLETARQHPFFAVRDDGPSGSTKADIGMERVRLRLAAAPAPPGDRLRADRAGVRQRKALRRRTCIAP
jgi:hypothetical protein